jgi:hypothetical protein
MKMTVVLEAIECIDGGAKVGATLMEVAKTHALSFEKMRAWYYAYCKEYPTTEMLMSDGWYYQKKTGKPDSTYIKHRLVTDE